MPAKADSIFFNEIVRMVESSGKSYPPTDPKELQELEDLKLYLETLDSIPINDYQRYPMSKPENAIGLDRMAFILKDSVERERACLEVERAIRTQGPLAFRTLTIVMFFQGLQQGLPKGNQNQDKLPPITAETILAYHAAIMQFQCMNESLEE